MQTLQEMISEYMYRISCVLVAVVVLMLLYLQMTTEQQNFCKEASGNFSQIEYVLEGNQRELEELEEGYRKTSLHNAEIIARVLENNQETLNDPEELKKIAQMVEVDEIHIIDEAGVIYAGTHPQYYGYSFDSGEQMGYFKPMLADKSLKLAQDLTPNTAEEKLMQYSAVWSENGTFIVEVGMEPTNVMKVTQKNELSYIFSLFGVNTEVCYYAVDAESKKIIASSDANQIGQDFTNIGFTLNHVELTDNERGFHANINEKNSFCVFKKIGTNYIGQTVASETLYQDIFPTICTLLLCLIGVTYYLCKGVTGRMDRVVGSNIRDISERLEMITDGNFEEPIKVHSSSEFAELSKYINSMVLSLVNTNKKMSYLLSKTDMPIGTYDYDASMKAVRFTGEIREMLMLEESELKELSADVFRFITFLDEVRQQPFPDDPDVYKIGNRYIRIEEVWTDDTVFGVVIDVTADIRRFLEIEKERDVDTLTGLYNRRGLDRKMKELLNEPEKLGHSAMIMIDADGLKVINDTYGHEKGDIYLRSIAEAIVSINTKDYVASRQGGDEFVVFLYNYESENALIEAVEALAEIQANRTVALDETVTVPLRFSLGYCLVKDNLDYLNLLKEADQKMYVNKVARKKQFGVITDK